MLKLLLLIALSAPAYAGTINPHSSSDITPSWFSTKVAVSNYGYSASFGNPNCFTSIGYTVPEPSSFILLITGLILMGVKHVTKR